MFRFLYTADNRDCHMRAVKQILRRLEGFPAKPKSTDEADGSHHKTSKKDLTSAMRTEIPNIGDLLQELAGQLDAIDQMWPRALFIGRHANVDVDDDKLRSCASMQVLHALQIEQSSYASLQCVHRKLTHASLSRVFKQDIHCFPPS